MSNVGLLINVCIDNMLKVLLKRFSLWMCCKATINKEYMFLLSVLGVGTKFFIFNKYLQNRDVYCKLFYTQAFLFQPVFML